MSNPEAWPVTTADLIDAAAVIVAAGWSQFRVALDPNGYPLQKATDPTASHVCALGAVAVAARDMAAPPELVFATVKELRDYLSTDTVAGWNAAQVDSGYVVTKLQAAARTIRRGGPAQISATPAAPVREIPVVAPRPKAVRHFTPESRMKLDRGRLAGTLTRQRKARVDGAKIRATEGRIAQLDRELFDRYGVPIPSGSPALPGPAAPPLDRRPGTESGL
jgi:hypothetical protein